MLAEKIKELGSERDFTGGRSINHGSRLWPSLVKFLGMHFELAAYQGMIKVAIDRVHRTALLDIQKLPLPGYDMVLLMPMM